MLWLGCITSVDSTSLTDQFRSSWQNEYLLSLRESLHSQRKHKRTAVNITPSINDIVQIKDDTPSGIWRLGRITEVHISYDGQVCDASVKHFSEDLSATRFLSS